MRQQPPGPHLTFAYGFCLHRLGSYKKRWHLLLSMWSRVRERSVTHVKYSTLLNFGINPSILPSNPTKWTSIWKRCEKKWPSIATRLHFFLTFFFHFNKAIIFITSILLLKGFAVHKGQNHVSIHGTFLNDVISPFIVTWKIRSANNLAVHT